MTKLLIVEDSATQAVELSLLLESQGFDVTVAHDGVSGLERCRKFVFDAVLSDVVMPGLDGYELCRQIKSNPDTASLPVILLTSLSDPMDIIRGLECGADNFITKPYEAAYLLDRVRGLLENKALRTARKLAVGVDVMLMGKRFTINSEKEQMVDLLISTFEEVLRSRQREYEAKLCEETVRESHRFLQSALDALSTQITMVDSSLTIVSANERWRTFAANAAPNWPNAGVGANYLAMWQQCFNADREHSEKVAAGLEAVKSGARKAFSHEYSARIASKWRWFTLTATRFEERGSTLFAVEHEDTTARKQLEQQFLHSQKMEAIGQLAGGVAHDFNNLLLVIGGYADLLARGFPADDTRVADVAEITQAVKTAAALTQQLLAFSRQQRLQPCVLNINTVVSDLEKMMKRLIGEHIRYTTHLDEPIGTVNADPGQLQQILMNLVVNARDAMPSGGSITVTTHNVTVDETYAAADSEIASGRYVVLSVNDTGQGMDAATRARIFEPFFTTKEVGKGTGLGLSTVYGITRQSGGHVWVYSELGQGTTFKIYLPRVDSVISNPPAQASLPAAAPRPATILVVEDNNPVRDLLQRILRSAGYTVHAASGPNEARTLCANPLERIDVLLTDVVMPDMSGPLLARELQSSRPDMALILMSGYSGAALQNREDKIPNVAVLEKPFTATAVLRAVRVALEEGGARRSVL
jgi:signal transduction histidine kinase/DNA-binding response OmpR family regulator